MLQPTTSPDQTHNCSNAAEAEFDKNQYITTTRNPSTNIDRKIRFLACLQLDKVASTDGYHTIDW
jgi:hypothetical protein